jgi:hypothetical protein
MERYLRTALLFPIAAPDQRGTVTSAQVLRRCLTMQKQSVTPSNLKCSRMRSTLATMYPSTEAKTADQKAA